MTAAAMAIGHDTATRALVVGLGATGFSCARYLHRNGVQVVVVDSRPQPPMAAALQQALPDVPLYAGDFAAAPWDAVDMIVASPGVALHDLPLAAARARGVEIVGDVELFARAVNAPVLAVTGSNGKSTVASLAGVMAQHAGIDTVVAGNIGVPVLDALVREPAPQLYVLELSSFQLETTDSLASSAAVVLNVSEDHMDRYPDLSSYQAAKARIFAHTRLAIVNRDDPATVAMVPAGVASISFGAGPAPGASDYGVVADAGVAWLVRGTTRLMRCNAVRLLGRHNHMNVLAAMALAQAAGVSDAAMIDAAKTFSGLPHRMQIVADIDGVRFIDDSKGTNVGATCAALSGLSMPVVLIAGGDGKGADFSGLKRPVQDRVRAVVLIGRDGERIAAALGGVVPVHFADSMDAAVRRAQTLAVSGDAVLLSPACASFDMFENYIARGNAFHDAVARLRG